MHKAGLPPQVIVQTIRSTGSTFKLAVSDAKRLKKAGVPQEVVDKSATLLDKPGISVIRDARVACDTVQVHSLHAEFRRITETNRGRPASRLRPLFRRADAHVPAGRYT